MNLSRKNSLSKTDFSIGEVVDVYSRYDGNYLYTAKIQEILLSPTGLKKLNKILFMNNHFSFEENVKHCE